MIPIYQGRMKGENGQHYDSFTVAAYINGKRRRWAFGDINDALAKAKELAESISNGQAELLAWPQSLRLEVMEVIKIASDSGVGLLPGVNFCIRRYRFWATQMSFSLRVA